MIQQLAFVLFIICGIITGYFYAIRLSKKYDEKIKSQINEKEMLEKIHKEIEQEIILLNQKEVINNGTTNTNTRRGTETERTISKDTQDSTTDDPRKDNAGEYRGISIPEIRPNDSTNGNDTTDPRNIKWA